MSDELHKPAVIDIEAMLQPISEESPSGESLRYSGIYDEISEARRADDNLNQGAWQTELKVADYRRVIELAVPAITSQSKDLQVAAWLSESLIKTHGFTGLRDSIQLLTGLQSNFWDTLHPRSMRATWRAGQRDSRGSNPGFVRVKQFLSQAVMVIASSTGKTLKPLISRITSKCSRPPNRSG
jgi:hypothetical protein